MTMKRKKLHKKMVKKSVNNLIQKEQMLQLTISKKLKLNFRAIKWGNLLYQKKLRKLRSQVRSKNNALQRMKIVKKCSSQIKSKRMLKKTTLNLKNSRWRKICCKKTNFTNQLPIVKEFTIWSSLVNSSKASSKLAVICVAPSRSMKGQKTTSKG